MPFFQAASRQRVNMSFFDVHELCKQGENCTEIQQVCEQLGDAQTNTQMEKINIVKR